MKSSGPDVAAAAGDRDERLAELLDQLTGALRQGHSPNVAALAQKHPDLAEELRTLWAAVLVAEGIAAARNSHSQTASQTSPQTAQRSLPRRFGDYELLVELGRGGMGVVYEARQISLDRVVALKMILHGEMASAADLARFRAEAQAVAQLDHPQIVPVYEVGELERQPYFTMKFIPGATLAHRLAEGPLADREAAALLVPICRAIQYAHEHGVLHRDLKPSNILLDLNGSPHVTDFGLAKRVAADGATLTAMTLTGAIIGTPSHMAPEQAAGDRARLGPACDIFSLGTILYQMLTGRPPFQAASPVDTVLLLLEQEPLPPRLINARIDPDLELIVLKCLQKPPELRYASADALAKDLQAYLEDEPIAARSGLFRQVVNRWLRETHHATVLHNWGLLWMWHSLALLTICLLTSWLQWRGTTAALPYLMLWTAGLGTWAGIFWALRRRAGPVTFVERQIAHIWAGSMVSIATLFFVEMLLKLPVLTLSPLLAITSGMVFLAKAGILSGAFYLQAVALFATALAMAWLQSNGSLLAIPLFGAVSAASFFFPGLKYYRQR